MPRRKKKSKDYKKAMAAREAGFNNNTANVKLPEYNGLYDKNLRHHFENRTIQSNLFKLGLIDREGRVLDIDKSKSKIFIIEQEFAAAEKAETMRMRDEAEMRRRVQRKRHETLERGRRAERLIKIKDDRRVRSEILRAAKGEVDVPVPKPKYGRTRRKVAGSMTGMVGTPDMSGADTLDATQLLQEY